MSNRLPRAVEYHAAIAYLLTMTMDSFTQSGEADLRAEFAALRERAATLEEQVPPLLQRISDVLPRISGETELADEHRERLVGARNAAMVSIENYQQAIPFVQTADSIIEQLDKTPERDEDTEWRDALLQRLDELIDVAIVMIDDADNYFEQARACDLASVPPSILED
ncbi:ATPase [Burkholderia multivorans]|nr:ATPase [Burkholderia multivorans]